MFLRGPSMKGARCTSNCENNLHSPDWLDERSLLNEPIRATSNPVHFLTLPPTPNDQMIHRFACVQSRSWSSHTNQSPVSSPSCLLSELSGAVCSSFGRWSRALTLRTIESIGFRHVLRISCTNSYGQETERIHSDMCWFHNRPQCCVPTKLISAGILREFAALVLSDCN